MVATIPLHVSNENQASVNDSISPFHSITSVHPVCTQLAPNKMHTLPSSSPIHSCFYSLQFHLLFTLLPQPSTFAFLMSPAPCSQFLI